MSTIMKKWPKAYSSGISSSLKPKFIVFFLVSLFISIKIILITSNFRVPKPINIIHYLAEQSLGSSYLSINVELPKWLAIIQGTTSTRTLNVGLINLEADKQPLLGGIANYVTIDLEPVSPNVTWNELFPENHSRCPEIPMPKAMEYPNLDVVVARLPCGEEKQENNVSHIEGIRDVHRLQLSLASAQLIVENAMKNEGKHVYGVFISKCEPMVEMFRCDDMIWHQGDYWVYKPKIDKLKEILSMPIGTCKPSPPYDGALGTRRHPKAMIRPREAYVTVLHSSESYVCGAIALAHSILLTNTTKDLVLLADPTISNHSIAGLQAAGWKIKLIERIRSPYANITAYNAWNYSKLRIWQLIDYSKVMFIDSDFIVLRNLDHFFNYPQLSAAPNNKYLFNSGIILLEPSECFFNTLMDKRYTIKSYNGGDQGYLNEVFTYWHSLSEKINYMKYFSDNLEVRDRVIVPEDIYAIHFLGLKPWKCYRDYDCNWDDMSYQIYASDDFHARWWKVYDLISKELQMHCGMTRIQDKRLRRHKVSAQLQNQADGHWKFEVRDPRQFNLQGLAS